MMEAAVKTSICHHKRICHFCEQNCATIVTVDHASNTVLDVRGDKDDPLSKGYICPKVYALKDLHHDPDVLTGPMVRRDGELQPASWEEALDFAARRIQEIQRKYGKDAIAFFFGTSIAHVPALALYTGYLLSILDTKQIYSTSSIDCHPHFMTSAAMFGGLASFPVPDVDRCDYFVLIGANPYQSNGSFLTAPNIKERLRGIQQRGGKVVVIDPRKTETANAADWYLSIAPGGDAAMLLAVVHTLFAEKLVNPGLLAAKLANIDELERLAQPFTPERVAERTGIAAEDIRRLAREIAAAPRACVYGRIGSCMQEFGSLTNWLIHSINAITGNLDRAGGAMFAQGVMDHFVISERCVDGQIPYDRYRSRVSNFPELAGQFPAAMLVEEMTTPGEGQIKALVTLGTNPVLSSPNGGGKFTAALEELEFMMSFDIYVNETTRHADVILPSPPQLSRSSFMLFLSLFTVRDYIKYVPAIFPMPEGQIEDSDIFSGLAARLTGVSALEADENTLRSLYDQLRAQGNEVLQELSFAQVVQHVGAEPGKERIFDMLLRAGPYGDHFGSNPDGLTLGKLKQHGDGIDFGPMQPRLEKVLYLPHGKVELAPPQITADLDRLETWLEASPDTGLHLIGRRQMRSCNTWMHDFQSLAKGKELCVLLIHPDDADARGIADGDRVTIRSRTGQIAAPASVSSEMRRGVVSLPHGWGHDVPEVPGKQRAKARPGANYNELADERLIDVPSGQINLNHIPVDVIREV